MSCERNESLSVPEGVDQVSWSQPYDKYGPLFQKPYTYLATSSSYKELSQLNWCESDDLVVWKKYEDSNAPLEKIGQSSKLNRITHLKFVGRSEDDGIILAGNQEGKLGLWTFSDSHLEYCGYREFSKSPISALAFTGESQRQLIAVGTEDGDLEVLELLGEGGGGMSDEGQDFNAGMQTISKLPHKDGFGIGCVTFAAFNIIVTGCHNQLLVWDLRSPDLKSVRRHTRQTKGMDSMFSIDTHPSQAHTICCGTTQGNLLIWDLRKEDQLPLQSQVHLSNVLKVQFNAQNPLQIFSSSEDGSLALSDINSVQGFPKNVLSPGQRRYIPSLQPDQSITFSSSHLKRDTLPVTCFDVQNRLQTLVASNGTSSLHFIGLLSIDEETLE